MRFNDVAGNICASSSPYLTHVVLVKVAHRLADLLLAVLADRVRDLQMAALHDHLGAGAGGRGGAHGHGGAPGRGGAQASREDNASPARWEVRVEER